MYLNTINTTYDLYNTKLVKLPPFSEIVDVYIKQNGMMNITYKSEYQTNYNDDTWGSYTFRSISGLVLNNIHLEDGYEYITTQRVEHDDFIDYIRIFVKIERSQHELRDEKINSIIQ